MNLWELQTKNNLASLAATKKKCQPSISDDTAKYFPKYLQKPPKHAPEHLLRLDVNSRYFASQTYVTPLQHRKWSQESETISDHFLCTSVTIFYVLMRPIRT